MKADQLDDNVKKALAVTFRANKIDKDEVNEEKVDKVDDVENKDIVDVRDYIGLDLYQHSNSQQNLKLSSSSTKTGSEVKSSLEDLLDKVYQANGVLNSIIAAKQAGLWKLPANLTTKQGIKLAIENFTLEGSRRSTRLYVKEKMYTPNHKNLWLFLLQQHHNLPTQGHLTYKAVL